SDSRAALPRRKYTSVTSPRRIRSADTTWKSGRSESPLSPAFTPSALQLLDESGELIGQGLRFVGVPGFRPDPDDGVLRVRHHECPVVTAKDLDPVGGLGALPHPFEEPPHDAALRFPRYGHLRAGHEDWRDLVDEGAERRVAPRE